MVDGRVFPKLRAEADELTAALDDNKTDFAIEQLLAGVEPPTVDWNKQL